jgi:hypothetical protein
MQETIGPKRGESGCPRNARNARKSEPKAKGWPEKIIALVSKAMPVIEDSFIFFDLFILFLCCAP